MVFCCKITIGTNVFLALNEIEINSSWKKFTDTATIKMPRNLSYRIGDDRTLKVANIRDLIKTGDKVKIELGYNTELITEFEGYVIRSPIMDFPYLIECEDEMWQLKKKRVSVSIEDATVRQILEAAAPGYIIDCVDEIYGDFSEVETTPVKIFETLKKTAGLYTFFRGKRLVCGLIFSDPKISQHVANYKVGKNVIDSSLQFKSFEESKLKMFGVSPQNDGSIIRVELGEDGGNIERINYVGITKKELTEILNRRFELHKREGSVSGSFTTFGFPKIQHGQTLRYIDLIKQKSDTKHYIDEYTINVSTSGGYKKTIYPGGFYTENK